MAMSEAEFERQFAMATKCGKARLRFQPRAVAVRFDRRKHLVIIELSNGCSLLVPPKLAEGLSAASVSELVDVQIAGPGTTVEWPKLDVQFSVAGLLEGRFGTESWMRGAVRDSQSTAAKERRRSAPLTRPRSKISPA